MILKTKTIDKSLTSKGFRSDRSGNHVRLRFYFGDEGSRFATMYSHGTSGKEIGDRLINSMAKQLEITKEQFVNLVGCSLSKDEILEIYLSKKA